MKEITIKNLSVTYDIKPVLWDINITFKQGDLVCIVGPNGAGKTTLIKTLINLIKPVTGEILFDNLKYKKVSKEIAYVPQKETVDWSFPITVFEAVMMGRYGLLGWFKRPSLIDKEKVNNCLEELNITNLKNKSIQELSGGQQQRVFLARALAQEASVYVLDEPFQGIDKKTEEKIISILKKLSKEGKIVICVHHDLNTVKSYFDKCLLVNQKVIGYSDVDKIFTKEIIEKTYSV